MTLVYERQPPNGGPQTHILIIGCGRFSHLPVNAQRQACADSARNMVEYLISKADDLLIPLGSVEVLISDPSVNPGEDRLMRMGDQDPRPTDEENVQSATFANVQQASDRWLGRYDQGRGDQFIFYACSHGVADGDRVGLLVLEDIKSNENRKWEQLLNIYQMASGITAIKRPSASWFFVDACQELLNDLLRATEGTSGWSPIYADVFQKAQATSDQVPRPIVVGLPFGQKTFAPEEGIAFLTEALRFGLDKCCFEFVRGKYMISGKQIAQGIADIAQVKFNRSQQASDWGLESVHSSALLFEVKEPEVPVMVFSYEDDGLRGKNPVRLLAGAELVGERGEEEDGDKWVCSVRPPFGNYALQIGSGPAMRENVMQIEAPVTIHEVY